MGIIETLSAILNPEPTPETKPLTVEKLDDFLADFQAAVLDHHEAPPPRQGLWIFTPTFDRAHFARQLLELIEETEVEARRVAIAKAIETAPLSCACRCRAHGRGGCHRCTTAESCPVHHIPSVG